MFQADVHFGSRVIAYKDGSKPRRYTPAAFQGFNSGLYFIFNLLCKNFSVYDP
jgi:hypothetical protein